MKGSKKVSSVVLPSR